MRLGAVVLVPDFFKGDGLSHDCIPPDTQEKKQTIENFLAHQANVSRNADVLIAAVGDYRSRFPSVRNWGTFGLCWGGKVGCASSTFLSFMVLIGVQVTAVISGTNTPFAASGQVHPG